MLKRFKKIQALALVALSLTGIFSGCSKNEIKNTLNTVDKIISSFDKENKNLEVDASIEELIAEIEIEEPQEDSYDRDEYTSSSQSYTFNGEKFTSIRNYAYYASIHYDENSDIYVDPYNGETLDSVKDVDYDHIIPLHYANQHGADEWSEDKKKEYADDPTVGVNVNSSDNRSKGDKGPCEWLPEENVEDYCYTWLVIAAKWDLSMDQECMDVIKENLNGVPQSELNLINEYK